MTLDIVMSSNTCSRLALRPVQAATTASADFPLAAHRRRPFRHEAGSPRVRTHSFTARPPDLRRFALVMRASRLLARSPCSAAPSIRFLFIGPRFTLHASSPRSVALAQLRFASLAMTSLWRDLHPQECARAGRTRKRQAGRCPPGRGSQHQHGRPTPRPRLRTSQDQWRRVESGRFRPGTPSSLGMN